MTVAANPDQHRRWALFEGESRGTFIKLPIVETVEIAALAGFDFIVIDMEHAPIGVREASEMIAIARHVGVAPIVRVGSVQGGDVQRLLDAGAAGLMLPHIDTPQQAQAAVCAARFPPLGQRGAGPTSRAGEWGLMPNSEYVRHGREDVILIAQLESAEATRNAEEIAKVAGIDALLVGLADLSSSVGLSPTDPAVQALVAAAIAGARVAEMPIGHACGPVAESIEAGREAGYTFVVVGNDATMLATAARRAAEVGS